MSDPTNARVTVVDVDMPFGSMVRFMVKWTLAAIPAIVILAVIFLAARAALEGVVAMLTSPSQSVVEDSVPRPGQRPAPAQTSFGIGSTRAEVVAAQGNPDFDPSDNPAVGGLKPPPRVFKYGEAEVIFGDDGRVVRWKDPKRTLRTR